MVVPEVFVHQSLLSGKFSRFLSLRCLYLAIFKIFGKLPSKYRNYFYFFNSPK